MQTASVQELIELMRSFQKDLDKKIAEAQAAVDENPLDAEAQADLDKLQASQREFDMLRSVTLNELQRVDQGEQEEEEEDE